jgi:DNA-directed RNA polymerase specialized sigma24 family protein
MPPMGRPSRQQRLDAVVDLLSDGALAFKATARRYSLCRADADDAYQRSLEILLTKAPTTDRDQLRPWLHTVIKHEALAVRRQRERLLGPGEPDAPGTGLASQGPEDGVAERERAAQTAEALRDLKPAELQCLLLKALGYSYTEISDRTGFSWTKVNRCLTEGRRRFFAGFAEIESGRRCQGFQPLLSAATDGEISAGEQPALARHLNGCQSCRALLREYRSVPERVAELLPPAALAPALVKDGWWSRLHDGLVGGTGDRVVALAHKLQQVAEGSSAQKAAVVVASSAALAGGAAVEERVPQRLHAAAHPAAKRSIDRAPETDAIVPRSDPAPPPTEPPPAKPPVDAPPAPPEEAAAAEFGPEAVAGAPAAAPSAPSSPPASAAGAPESEWVGGPAGPAGGGSAGGGGGEFGP